MDHDQELDPEPELELQNRNQYRNKNFGSLNPDPLSIKKNQKKVNIFDKCNYSLLFYNTPLPMATIMSS